MGNKVQSIDGGPVPEASPSHDGLVKSLEKLLEAAKSGEIQGLAGAIMYRDGSSSIRIAGLGNRTLVGGLAIAQSRLIEELDE